MNQENQVVVSTTRDRLKNQLIGLGKLLGFHLLNREQTTALLANYRIAAAPGDQVTLPPIDDFADSGKAVFRETIATAEPVYVWHYEAGTKRIRQLPHGSLVSRGRVFCVDWLGGRRLLNDVIKPPKRVTQEVQTLIAPWSHYQDGIRFGGYYDYVVLVAAKLCRIKETMLTDEFNRAVVAYPLFNTTYERELLALIGFGPDRIFDSRLTNVRFDTCVLGNSGHWFYPNVADLVALKRQVESQLPVVASESKRLYISRSGRRRILNEDALIELLVRYNIDIIEDKPRTVAEQVLIYRSASFIIGPHGASFTNILWCQPGAHLVELFSPNYVPDFFLYMAQRLGLRYSAYFHGPGGPDRSGGLEEDILVSIPDLERSLNGLFAEETAV